MLSPGGLFLSTRSIAIGSRGWSAEVALVHGILSPEFCREHGDRVAAFDRSLRAFPAKRRNLLVLALAAARHDVDACLKQTRAAALLLFGSRDPIAGMTAQRQLRADLPHATLQIIPDAGHDVSLERPEATAESIIGFLDGAAKRR